MDRFEKAFQERRDLWKGERIPALWDLFLPTILNRALMNEIEFIRLPNRFGISGGAASNGSFVLVVPIDVPAGNTVEKDLIGRHVSAAEEFLNDVGEKTSGIPSRDPVRVLRDMFRNASKATPDIYRATDLFVFTPGKVSALTRDRNGVVGKLRVQYIDIDDFQGHSGEIGSEVEFSDLGDHPMVYLASSLKDDHDLYMGVVSGLTLAKLFDQMGNSLLSSNVRMFLGDRGVNRGIATTIEESPSRFAAYNNGITMVSRKTTVEEGRVITASDVSIVNGGQTTVSIYKSFRNGIDVSKVKVPLKLVVIGASNEARRPELLKMISRYSNTQNKVNSADRLAQDKPHPQLQAVSLSAKHDVDGKGWMYERIRGEIRTLEISDEVKFNRLRERFPTENVMDATTVAKIWNSWWGLPHMGTRGNTKAFEYYHDQLQMKMYSRKWSEDTHHIQTIPLWLMYRHLHYYIGKNYSGLRQVVFPHVLAWFSSLTEGKLDLRSLAKKGKLSNPVILCLEGLVGPVDGTIREYVDGDQKEWAKSEECAASIRELTPPSEYEENSSGLPLLEKASGLTDPEKILPYLHEIGKDKIYDSMNYLKDTLGDLHNAGYLYKSMFKWPNLSPGGASVVIRDWHKAIEYGYGDKFPGPDDFFNPEGRNK